MRLKFCAACGARDDLQQHHLVHRTEGGGDEETNLVTLCSSCHLRAHGKRRRKASRAVVPVPVLQPRASLLKALPAFAVLIVAAVIWYYARWQIIVFGGIGFAIPLASELRCELSPATHVRGLLSARSTDCTEGVNTMVLRLRRSD